MSERNKLLVRRAVEDVWNRGNVAIVDELVASDVVIHASREIQGPAGIKQVSASLRQAFPDLHVAIEDQIAEGDKVVTRWTARGTHTGAFQGMPPTGKPCRFTGIAIDRIANDKTVECWTNVDELGLLHQLGAMPMPAPVGA